jgi:mannosyltransferase OCH1-like enzyme
LVLNGLKQLRDRNPTWSFEISDDDDVNQYLSDHLDDLDWDLLKDKHIVEKVDVWRLLKMVKEGGLYTDIDRYCNVILDSIIDPHTEICLPIHRNIDFSQDFMCAMKGHWVHMRALQLNLERRRKGCTDIMTLGPITYFHAVTEWLLGEQLERGTGINILKHIITHNPKIKTYDETGPKDSFLYRPNYICQWIEGNGGNFSDFYEESEVTHWTVAHPHDCNNKPYGN